MIAMPSQHHPRSEELAAADVQSRSGNDDSCSDQEIRDEESRIREVYAERKRAIPPGRYSAHNPGNVYILRELERHLLANLEPCQPLSSKRILDIGCGTGFWLQKFLSWGAAPENLYGTDLLEERITEARRQLPPQATVSVGNACKLNFADESFDLVLQFVVFSSVLHAPTRRRIASEMIRVLKPGGHMVWYDFFFNNPSNRNVRGVGKKEITDLFPGCRLRFRRITVAPPLTRQMGPLAPFLYPVLAGLGVCYTHYLVQLEK